MHRQQRVVKVRFALNGDGCARDVTFVNGPESRLLDQQSLELIRCLRFPEPPLAELAFEPIEVAAPIHYSR